MKKIILLIITALLIAPGLVSADLLGALENDADDVANDANSVSKTVTQQTKILTHKDLPLAKHLVTQQAGVLTGHDANVAGHFVDQNGIALGHFLRSNSAMICRGAIGKAAGTLLGYPCKKAVVSFMGECVSEPSLVAEPEIGITACTAATIVITKACSKTLTQVVISNSIHRACDSLTDQ